MLYNTKFGKIWGDTEAEKDAVLLDLTKKDLVTKLYAVCDSKMKQLGVGYPERETATWPVQLEEAKAYLADNSVDTPLISSSITGDETIEYYANLVIANNAAWSAYAGAIIKLRREKETAINSATTVEELETIKGELYA